MARNHKPRTYAKVGISLPQHLLAEIDSMAEILAGMRTEQGALYTRSTVIQYLITESLETGRAKCKRVQGARADRATRAARRHLDVPCYECMHEHGQAGACRRAGCECKSWIDPARYTTQPVEQWMARRLQECVNEQNAIAKRRRQQEAADQAAAARARKAARDAKPKK